MLYEIDVLVAAFPEPYRDGNPGENEMRGIAWGLGSARFVNVAEIHEGGPKRKRLGMGL